MKKIEIVMVIVVGVLVLYGLWKLREMTMMMSSDMSRKETFDAVQGPFDVRTRFAGRQHSDITQMTTTHIPNLVRNQQREDEHEKIHGYSGLNALPKSYGDKGDEHGLDNVFHPPPAVSERIQSIQYEHLVEHESPNWDFVDRETKYGFPLVPISSVSAVPTIKNYQSITRAQIDLMESTMLKQFSVTAKDAGVAPIEFEAVFTKARRINEDFMQHLMSTALQSHLLRRYLQKITDDIFDDLKNLFHGRGVVIKFNGTAEKIPARRGNNPFAVHKSGSKGVIEPLRLIDHELVKGYRNVGTAISDLPESKTRTIAQSYVIQTYNSLRDKHKYIINEMPQAKFSKRAVEILAAGNDAVDDFLRFNPKPNHNDLDFFLDEVNGIMEEELFDILVENNVNLAEFE